MTDGSIGPDAVHLLALQEVHLKLTSSRPVDIPVKYSCQSLIHLITFAIQGKSAYGFAFVDCAASRFWVGFIEDDASCSSLGTLLMQVSSSQFLSLVTGKDSDLNVVYRSLRGKYFMRPEVSVLTLRKP